MSELKLGSLWDFKGDKIIIVAISDEEVAFQYVNGGRFDVELRATWNRVTKPWRDKTSIDELKYLLEKINVKIADKRTGDLRYFTIVEVEYMKDLLTRVSKELEKED